MNIAIDIDDTIYFLSKRIDSAVQRYLKGLRLNYKPIKTKYYLTERYPDLVLDNHFTFYMHCLINSLYNRKMKRSVKKALLEIMKNNKVYFMTNRSKTYLENPYGFTFYWLCKYLGVLNSNNLYVDVKDKGSLCEELGCTILIDNDRNILNKAKGKVKYRINLKDSHTIHEQNIDSNGCITMTT